MTGANSPHTETTGDIIVEGYSRRFQRAVAVVLDIEGGDKFVDDKLDRGGATKYGISLRFLAAEGAIDLDQDGKADFDLDGDGDIDGQDVRRLTRGDAVHLYHRCFWHRLGAEQFARPIGEMLFDQAVNGGIGSARKLLQRAINQCLLVAKSTHPRLTVDGAIGPLTMAALQWVLAWPAAGMPALMEAYRGAAKQRYRDIVLRNPSQQRFLKGWLARADKLGKDL